MVASAEATHTANRRRSRAGGMAGQVNGDPATFGKGWTEMTRFYVAIMSALGLNACVVPASQYRAQELETKKCYQALENENASKKQLEVAVQDLQTAMDELTAERAKLSSEKGQLEGSVLALEKTVNDRLKEVRQLSRRNLQLETEQATLAAKNQTFEDLVSSLEKEMKDKLIEVRRQGQRITVKMSDRILFDSGNSDIKASGTETLKKISVVLAKVKDRRIDVEGHTDDVPIAKELEQVFPTNWELSVSRAANVVRFLETNGVASNRLAAVGMSQYWPTANNASKNGRQLNRRIEIVLSPWDGK
jgi:chemotaxis protein MotB